MLSLETCEKCGDQAVAVSEDGEALCEDCIFKQACEEMFTDMRGDD